MIRVIKEYHFDAAHRLTDYKGLCNNVHGHSYKVQICFERGIEIDDGLRSCSKLDEQGMVVDFKDVRTIIGEWIDEKLDHAIILNELDNYGLIQALQEMNMRIFFIDGSPTAERIALKIFEVAKANTFESDIYPIWVKVWETETSFAHVERE